MILSKYFQKCRISDRNDRLLRQNSPKYIILKRVKVDLETSLFGYWTDAHLMANALIVLNLGGALALGLVLGYERSFHGRAAGMRTYGLVCMVSAGIVLVSGYPELWYGLQLASETFRPDPTRSIQGIVTGIGFLCAGVIMKDGFSISGLTTAASIWTVSAVGILVGVGLYVAAIAMTAGALLCMTMVSKLEARMPSRPAAAVMLRFRHGYSPSVDVVRAAIGNRGYTMAQGSISIVHRNGQTEWSFVVLAEDRSLGGTLPHLSAELLNMEGLEDFNLSLARN